MDKNFIFTVDDNIKFLRQICEQKLNSIFDHPYLALLENLHDKFDLKIQLNLFYKDELFTLSDFPDKYKCEWENCSNWLKLSFHSLIENIAPYKESDYNEVYNDALKVKNEILRFAGEKSLAKTTTIHYCLLTDDGLSAVKDLSILGLLGLYGTDDNKRTSYLNPDFIADKIRQGNIVDFYGIYFAGIDVVINLFSVEENLKKVNNLLSRSLIKVMIHEQYFYKDYFNYQEDFSLKLYSVFEILTNSGFNSKFFEDLI